jgi:hypothetical protein
MDSISVHLGLIDRVGASVSVSVKSRAEALHDSATTSFRRQTYLRGMTRAMFQGLLSSREVLLRHAKTLISHQLRACHEKFPVDFH